MGKIKPVSKKNQRFFYKGPKKMAKKPPQQAAQPDGLEMISRNTLAFLSLLQRQD